MSNASHLPGQPNGTSPVLNAACAPELAQGKDDVTNEERHASGCICADCSGAELTAEND